MSEHEFDVFARQDEYHTPSGIKVPLINRTPGLRSFYYHSAFVCGLLRRSWRLTKQGRFDEIAHAEAGFFYLRHMERAGAKVHITGLDNLNKTEGPAVFVANHMSLCETFVLAPMIVARKQKNSFVIKESLSRYPVFGPIVSSTKPVTVTRKKPREDFKQVMRQGQELLDSGRSVTIFPQNRRRQYLRQSEFNTIGAKLAARAKVPLIPVALRTDFLAPGKIILDFGRIRPERPVCFAFGPPLGAEIDSRERHRLCLEFIRSRLQDWNIPCMD